MANLWTSSDPRWLALTPSQKAAAMALMEANTGKNYSRDATDVAGAIVNRANRDKQDLGTHVSQRIYQPTIEPKQEARLAHILSDPQFSTLSEWVDRRNQGLEPDPVNGATHYLAPEQTMLSLERSNPAKYHNWGPRGANWTGFDPATGAYRNVTVRDSSHAFLAPEGGHSAPYTGGAFTAPSDGTPPVLKTDAGRTPHIPQYAPDPTADPQGAFASALADMPKPTAVASAAPLVSGTGGGGFGSPLAKSSMGALGAVASAFSGANQSNEADVKATQEALAANSRANAQGLNEQEQSQQAALQDILKKLSATRPAPSPTAAFG